MKTNSDYRYMAQKASKYKSRCDGWRIKARTYETLMRRAMTCIQSIPEAHVCPDVKDARFILLQADFFIKRTSEVQMTAGTGDGQGCDLHRNGCQVAGCTDYDAINKVCLYHGQGCKYREEIQALAALIERVCQLERYTVEEIERWLNTLPLNGYAVMKLRSPLDGIEAVTGRIQNGKR